MLLLAVGAVSLDCGAGVPPRSARPTSSPDAREAGSRAALPAESDPFEVPASPRDDDGEVASRSPAPVALTAWQKARAAKVGPRPPACSAYASRAAKKATSLPEALAERDPGERDARLVALVEPSNARFVALRAELAPLGCADAIVDPFLDGLAAKGRSSTMTADETTDFVGVAIGLSLAAKLSRSATGAPLLGASIRDPDKLKAFLAGPLKTWLVEQSLAIEVLSSGASGLSGYARGVSAIEAGVAELRLIDQIRSAPIPTSWDPELKAVYETTLDEALEPRKRRGRDAVLVGMSDLARLGIVREPRLERARGLLSKLYGGRRIDALDGLLLAPIDLPSPASAAQIVASTLPLPWLDSRDVVSAQDPHFLSRGVSRSLIAMFRSRPDDAPASLRTAYARARLELGRVYWRRVDFIEAAHAIKSSKRPEDRLLLAVSLALAHGPNGAASMMAAESPAELGLGHTEALDALAKEGGPLAGLAAYDAAYVRALSPPEGDAASAYLRDVSSRFRAASLLLTLPEQRKIASRRADDIDAMLAAR